MNYTRMSSFMSNELCSLVTESLECWDQGVITRDRFLTHYQHIKTCLGQYDAPIHGEMSVLNYKKTTTRFKRMGEIIKSWDTPQTTQEGNN